MKYRIIWINGAFGSGKTTCANLLKELIKDSIIFDPEIPGIMINNIIPSDIKLNDFQDHKEWREINNILLCKLFYQSKNTIIIPMTITNQQYFNEIVKNIPKNNIKQVILNANKNTLIKRLSERGEQIGTWPYQQIEKCLYAFVQFENIEIIETDDKEKLEIVNEIIGKIQ